MAFIALVIIAIILYVRDYKIPALIVFFFFLTSGFNLVTEEAMDIGPISKGSDFAFFTLLGIVIIDSFCKKEYLKVDHFVKYLLPLGIFLVVCIIYSRWVVGLEWSGIFRTSRYLFFWIAYFIFRSLEKETLEKIMRILFTVVVFLSVLYLLQILLNTFILNEASKVYLRIGGWKIPRFYNQPDMLQFFTLLAIYHNPYKNAWKRITTCILVLALLGAFHRSLMGMFLFLLLLSYIVRLERVRRIRFMALLGVIVIGGLFFAGVKLMQSRIYMDLQNIANGNYADVETTMDTEELQESTFTFRIALFYERNQYVLEHPIAMVLGSGLIPEDSNLVDKMFDFKIGLLDDITDKAVQVETGDIAYGSMVLRLGYAGSALYLMLWIYLMVFFYKNRENPYGLPSFLYMVLSIFIALFSGNLLIAVNYLLPLMSYTIIRKTNKEIPELAE